MKIRRVLALATLLTTAILASACLGDKGDTIVQTGSSNSTGISVTANGRAVGVPDVIDITLGVGVERPTVDAARSAAATSQQAIIDSLKANGIADKDIQTVGFSIQPQYDFSRGVQAIRGYRVSNTVVARVRKLETAGKVIDDAARAGGNDTQVQNVNLTIDDPTKLLETARADAMKQAKAKAEQLADQAGVDVGNPTSISESGGFNPPSPVSAPRTDALSADAVTPIQQGELVVNVSVTVTYAIE